MLLETTNRCNLQCPMCPRTHEPQAERDMPDELLYRVIEEFAMLGGDHLYLYGLGEPLLDPRLFDLTRRCAELDIGTIVSTNGVLLDEQHRAALLDSPCDHLLIGIDGHTEETYDLYRPGGDLERVRRQVIALAAEKRRRRVRMTLVVQLIRMPHNLHEVDDFVASWSRVPGVDLVRVKDEDLGLEEHRIYEPDAHLRGNPCHLLWRGAVVIRASGQVYPCYHIADIEEDGHIGDLHESSLAELWDGPAMRELRHIQARDEVPADHACSSCPCVRPRLPLIVGSMAVRGTVARRVVPLLERVALRLPYLVSERRIPRQFES